MTYLKKYLKYKNKYLNLIKLKGGEHIIFEIISNVYDLERVDKVTKIINTLQDLNIKNSDGIPLLTMVMMSFNDNYTIAKLLIEKGANINIIDDKIKMTPLMHLLGTLNKESYEFDESIEYDFVKYLIDKGANINFENENKESVLYFSIKNRLYKIMMLLLNEKVEIKSDFYLNCPLAQLISNAALSESAYEESLAIAFIRKGALIKENIYENVKVIKAALMLELPNLLTFLIDGDYDSQVSGLLYEYILSFAEEKHIEYLIKILKKKIFIGQINVKFGSKEIKMRANDKFTVLELKENICELIQVDFYNIHLLIQHNGKKQEMDDKRTLSDYGLHKFKELNIDVIPKIKTGKNFIK